MNFKKKLASVLLITCFISQTSCSTIHSHSRATSEESSATYEESEPAESTDMAMSVVSGTAMAIYIILLVLIGGGAAAAASQ